MSTTPALPGMGGTTPLVDVPPYEQAGHVAKRFNAGKGTEVLVVGRWSGRADAKRVLAVSEWLATQENAAAHVLAALEEWQTRV